MPRRSDILKTLGPYVAVQRSWHSEASSPKPPPTLWGPQPKTFHQKPLQKRSCSLKVQGAGLKVVRVRVDVHSIGPWVVPSPGYTLPTALELVLEGYDTQRRSFPEHLRPNDRATHHHDLVSPGFDGLRRFSSSFPCPTVCMRACSSGNSLRLAGGVSRWRCRSPNPPEVTSRKLGILSLNGSGFTGRVSPETMQGSINCK